MLGLIKCSPKFLCFCFLPTKWIQGKIYSDSWPTKMWVLTIENLGFHRVKLPGDLAVEDQLEGWAAEIPGKSRRWGTQIVNFVNGKLKNFYEFLREAPLRPKWEHASTWNLWIAQTQNGFSLSPCRLSSLLAGAQHIAGVSDGLPQKHCFCWSMSSAPWRWPWFCTMKNIPTWRVWPQRQYVLC